MAQISILMPVYNAQHYLRECLQSIQAQTFQDYEVLMIDDGSTDGSGQICDAFAAQDSRFKVRHQINGGGGVARNAALRWAMQTDSRYLVWIDADDRVAAEYLLLLYEKMEKHPDFNIVQCGFTSDRQELEAGGRPTGKSWSIENVEELLSEMQSGKHGIAFTVLWNKIYRKEVFQNVQVQITEQVSGRIYNDVNLLWQVYLNAGNCFVFDSVLYYYRYVPTSVQHKKLSSRKLEFLPLYYHVHEVCQQEGLSRYADFLSERMLFSLANTLGCRKKEYESYADFYCEAKKMFAELCKKMEFRCSRWDLKLLYFLGTKYFFCFTAYGVLYAKMKAMKNKFRQ